VSKNQVRISAVAAICIVFVAGASGWVAALAPNKRHADIGVALYANLAIVLVLAAFVLYLVVANAPALLIMLNSLAVISNTLAAFTGVYYNIGNNGNFSVKLTHLDSVYVALGTATTAGTGSIAAQTDTARLVQTIQMGTDFVIIGIVLTVAITAIMSKQSAR
jgi:uncharacterized membrane protein